MGARVFIAKQALEEGLVDAINQTQEQALEELAEACGIKDNYRVIGLGSGHFLKRFSSYLSNSPLVTGKLQVTALPDQQQNLCGTWVEAGSVHMKNFCFMMFLGFVFRAYFALPEMRGPNGESTQAVFGFIRSLDKLIKDLSPEYVVAVFDGPNNKQSRQELYADYKSNRDRQLEDLPEQIRLVKQYCELLGISCLEEKGVEADDVIASITKKRLQMVLKCVFALPIRTYCNW